MEPVEDKVFQLFMERFDRVDADNKTIADSLTKHIVDDNKVAKVVAQHSTYWSLLLKVGGGLFAVVIAIIIAFFELIIKH